MTGYGLTDLERGKYLPGGSNVNSTVRVQPNAYSALPKERYFYQVKYAQNAGSSNQLVNGSVTPVDFVHDFPNRTLTDHLDFVLISINSASVMDYGTIVGGLTNGIQLIVKRGVNEFVFFTIKRFVDFGHVSSLTFDSKKISGNQNEDFIQISLRFKDPSILEAGDQFIVRIRDDLTGAGLLYQRSSIILKEV